MVVHGLVSVRVVTLAGDKRVLQGGEENEYGDEPGHLGTRIVQRVE